MKRKCVVTAICFILIISCASCSSLTNPSISSISETHVSTVATTQSQPVATTTETTAETTEEVTEPAYPVRDEGYFAERITTHGGGTLYQALCLRSEEPATLIIKDFTIDTSFVAGDSVLLPAGTVVVPDSTDFIWGERMRIRRSFFSTDDAFHLRWVRTRTEI